MAARDAVAAAQSDAAKGDRVEATSGADGLERPDDSDAHGSATAEAVSHATRAIADAFDRSLTPARAWVP